MDVLSRYEYDSNVFAQQLQDAITKLLTSQFGDGTSLVNVTTEKVDETTYKTYVVVSVTQGSSSYKLDTTYIQDNANGNSSFTVAN
jgi:ABC-type antimicrobial peptide transport system permease subunit